MPISLPPPKIKNSFSNCVALKLHFDFNPSSSQEIDVGLTINFSGEQEIEIPIRFFPSGKICFGIKRGTLKLVLNNIQMPLEKVELSHPLPLFVEVERQDEKAVEFAATGTIGEKPTLSPGVKITDKSGEKVKTQVAQVYKSGGEDNPSWIFRVYEQRDFLLGALKQQKLGTLEVKARPCEVTATFTSSCDDIWIERGKFGVAEGKDLSNNKLAFIEHLIIRNFFAELFKKPLCEVNWRYE